MIADHVTENRSWDLPLNEAEVLPTQPRDSRTLSRADVITETARQSAAFFSAVPRPGHAL
jgi:hypothetical protein